MKKSVKEQLEKHAVTPYPNAGWQTEFVVPVSVAMRIARRACKEAYETGLRDGGSLSPASLADADYMRGLKRRTPDLIINGPKKAKYITSASEIFAKEFPDQAPKPKKGKRK